jgi:hypothetical protein
MTPARAPDRVQIVDRRAPERAGDGLSQVTETDANPAFSLWEGEVRPRIRSNSVTGAPSPEARSDTQTPNQSGDAEMPDCEQEPKNSARKNSSKSLAECAREAEHEWRVKLGLSKGLHRRGNAFARERRRRAECPNEPKAAVRYRRYRKK